MNQDETWKRKEKHGRELERENNKRLRALETKVFEIIVRELQKQYTFSGDTVERSLQNLRVTSAINNAFKQIDELHGHVMMDFARELLKSSNYTQAYFKLLAPNADVFKSANNKALAITLRSLGMRVDEGNLKIVSGGFLNTLLEDNFLRKQVQAEARSVVLSGGGFESLSSRIRRIVKGAPGKTGSFERYYNTYAYDFINRVDRTENDTYARELGLQAFVYAGTEIGNTRDFCAKRIGKVFLRSEAKKWKKIRFEGKPKTGYDPLRDLGGYNCRHVARFISNRKAVEMRDDLYIEDGKLKKRKQ